MAVAKGVRSIEHGNLLDAPTAALMAGRGAFLVPTLVTYDAMERRGAELGLAPVAQAKNREVLDAGRTAIGLAREARSADPIVGTSIIALRLWVAIGILGVFKHLWDKWEQGGSRPAVSH